MNAYVVIFAAVLVAAQAMPQGVGWGAPLPLSTVDLLLASGTTADAEGAADASQVSALSATGSALNPAIISSNTGTAAQVDQAHNHQQIGNINTLIPTADSSLVSHVQNVAAGEDHALSILDGLNVSFINAGSDSASGAGSITNTGSSSNHIQKP